MNNGNKEYMKDSRGRLVPEDMVSDIDKLRDQTVREMIGYAEEMRDALRQFRVEMMENLYAFVSTSVEQYGTKAGGPKGNVQLTSYDGTRRVDFIVAPTIVFDERLQAAKDLIDECLQEWSIGARSELQTLIADAFQVDSAGRIATWRVLGLRKHNIDDPKWLRAMRAISESIQVVGKQEYIRFYTRPTPTAKWQRVSLDLASA